MAGGTYIVRRWVIARWIVDNIGRSALNLSVEFLGPEQECTKLTFFVNAKMNIFRANQSHFREKYLTRETDFNYFYTTNCFEVPRAFAPVSHVFVKLLHVADMLCLFRTKL
jgi:hypothetical protein